MIHLLSLKSFHIFLNKSFCSQEAGGMMKKSLRRFHNFHNFPRKFFPLQSVIRVANVWMAKKEFFEKKMLSWKQAEWKNLIGVTWCVAAKLKWVMAKVCRDQCRERKGHFNNSPSFNWVLMNFYGFLSFLRFLFL